MIANIEKRIQSLAALKDVEVIFVDGESSDNTVAKLEGLGFEVLVSTSGRARQMNVGAAGANGEILLFLHVDSGLPQLQGESFDRFLRHALKKTAKCWGRFDVTIDGKHWLFPIIAFLMNWRSRLTGIATGDQGLFMTKQAFCAVGGFADIELMEDIALSSRLLKLSRPVCIKEKLSTSGRRWEKYGIYRTILLMWRLRLAYWLGHSSNELAARYR